MAKNSKRLYWILGLVLVVIIIIAAVGKRQGWIGKEEGIEVNMGAVQSGTISERVSASGKIQPEVEVKISPDVSGEIIELKVREGDSVKAGQLLCRIRPDNYRSAVERSEAAVNSSRANLAQMEAAEAQAESQLIRARQDYDRNRRLYADKVIPESEWQTIETNFKVAQQAVQSARANVEAARFNVRSAQAGLKDANENLRKTSIFAPVSGTISKLSVELGERVVGTSQMAGTEMMRLANLRNMEVLVDVNENDIVRVNVGDTAVIDVDSYTSSGRTFKGLITSIANTAKTQASLDVATEFEVKVRILNESYKDLEAKLNGASPFRPGMTANVEIMTERRENVLMVPLSAVTTRSKADTAQGRRSRKSGDDDEDSDAAKPARKEEMLEIVFVNENGKARMQQVKTGISDFDNIEIVSGLKPGQQIISGPFLAVSKTLRNGSKVKVAEPKKKKSGFSVTVGS